MTSQQQSPNPDFAAAWREWLSKSEGQWNSYLNQVMGTPEFSQNAGRSMDLYLHFQRTMNEAMGAWFTAINVPTRNDVLELGERLLDIEGRLAAIEAALSRVTAPSIDAHPSRPPRTKRPPTPSSS